MAKQQTRQKIVEGKLEDQNREDVVRMDSLEEGLSLGMNKKTKNMRRDGGSCSGILEPHLAP